MNESTLAAKRWVLNMQGFGVFRRAGREANLQNAVVFSRVSNLEESHQNL